MEWGSQICMRESWHQGRVDCGVREIKKKQAEQSGDQLVQARLDLKEKRRTLSEGGKTDLMKRMWVRVSAGECDCRQLCVRVSECAHMWMCLWLRKRKEVQRLELRIWVYGFSSQACFSFNQEREHLRRIRFIGLCGEEWALFLTVELEVPARSRKTLLLNLNLKSLLKYGK